MILEQNKKERSFSDLFPDCNRSLDFLLSYFVTHSSESFSTREIKKRELSNKPYEQNYIYTEW